MSTARLNGRHLTAVIVAVCVAIVLAPVSVLATSSSGGKVYITDPHNHSYRAAVSPNGALSIGGTVNVGNLPRTQPVSGSVNVGNLPATQDVDGTVNVGNLPATQNVTGTVTAAPGLPGSPYSSTDFEVSSTASVTAPAGKTLVIQDVSMRVEVPSGAGATAVVQYITNGSFGFVFVPLTLALSSGGTDFYVGNETVTLYADPGSTISLLGSTGSGGGSSTTYLVVNGYSLA